MSGDEWPSRYCTSSSRASCSIAQVANVWRKRWAWTFGIPWRPSRRSICLRPFGWSATPDLRACRCEAARKSGPSSLPRNFR